MLYDPSAHELLADIPWDENLAREATREAVATAGSGYDAETGRWALHPLDRGGKDDDYAGVRDGVYLGAAGMLWALDRLSRAGVAESSIGLPAAAASLHAGYVARCHAPQEPIPVLWTGEAGVLLVATTLAPDDAPDDALDDALLRTIRANERDPALEILWGAPGTMLAALEMVRRTGERRWAEAWRESATAVLGEWRFDEEIGGRIWTNVLLGKPSRGLGAVHGFAGNILSLAAGFDLLPEQTRTEIAIDATRTALATASVEGGLANWPTSIGSPVGGEGARTQWCHGAPGIVAALAGLPREPELDALLLAGGELVWRAGPLAKGAGLCHGTAGNGLAFLRLFERTGDELWLARARSFAMHALAQAAETRRRHGQSWFGLWTGDLGTALYAWQCIDGDPSLPTLTAW